jgi:methyl-accepting chemotaxis protein
LTVSGKRLRRISNYSVIKRWHAFAAAAQTVIAMKDIAGKISIIEEIARQTNLLALFKR